MNSFKRQTCKSVVPIVAMLRATPADQIKSEQKYSKYCANSDCNVERCEVAVDVLLEKRIIQICCALLDSGHCFSKGLAGAGDQQTQATT